MQAAARGKWLAEYLVAGCLMLGIGVIAGIGVAVAIAVSAAPVVALLVPLLAVVVAIPNVLTGMYAVRNGDRLPPWWNTLLGVAYCPIENHYFRGYMWALGDCRRKKRGEPPKVIHMCPRVREIMIRRYPPRRHTEWPKDWKAPDFLAGQA